MIINSLLDNDMYKFTMAQCVLHHYPNVEVEYKFKCRNHKESLGKIENLFTFVKKVNTQIEYLSRLKMGINELKFLKTIRFFKPDFLNFLSKLQLNPQEKYAHCYVHNDELHVTIKGLWINTIWLEVPILAIISELYTQEMRQANKHNTTKYIINTNKRKFPFADMGTRRRASYMNQRDILLKLKDFPEFTGTSNLHFAQILSLTPIGTMAHEWIQAHQQLAPIMDSQKIALQTWANEYRGDLGIALSDTLGFKKFLAEFDLYFAKLFDGCRHDSGDPHNWTDKLITHYKKLGIDPKTKTAIYSDGLDFDTCSRIWQRYNKHINISFGIGTWLTNNIGNVPPQIVIKMVKCNGGPVAKISDDNGKIMCENEDYLNYLKKEVE